MDAQTQPWHIYLSWKQTGSTNERSVPAAPGERRWRAWVQHGPWTRRWKARAKASHELPRNAAHAPVARPLVSLVSQTTTAWALAVLDVRELSGTRPARYQVCDGVLLNGLALGSQGGRGKGEAFYKSRFHTSHCFTPESQRFALPARNSPC